MAMRRSLDNLLSVRNGNDLSRRSNERGQRFAARKPTNRIPKKVAETQEAKSNRSL